MNANSQSQRAFDPYRIERPDPALFKYYVLSSLLSGPLIPLILAPLWFRYLTLRYQFDDSGVSMRWGIIFRREVYLTYRRIQDIHLTRNILQRWMGLAKISLQTASGSSQAEMAIEGILEADELRDFLYSRMRGAKNEEPRDATLPAETGLEACPSSDQATRLLKEIRDALKQMVERREENGQR